MKDFWNRSVAGFNVWKLAWFKAFLVSFIAGANVVQTSMSGIDWEILSATQKLLVYNGVVIAIASSLVAFLDKTMSGIEMGIETDKIESAEKIKV